jgi:hypothetical protein
MPDFGKEKFKIEINSVTGILPCCCEEFMESGCDEFPKLFSTILIGFLIELLLECFDLLVATVVTDNIVREPNKGISPDNFVVKVRQCLYGVIVLLVNNKREPESQTGDIDGTLINIDTVKAFTNGVPFEPSVAYRLPHTDHEQKTVNCWR